MRQETLSDFINNSSQEEDNNSTLHYLHSSSYDYGGYEK